MKQIMLLLALVLSLGAASALTMQEQTFGESGLETISVSGAQNELCTQPISFIATQQGGSLFEVVSLHVKFYPVSDGAATVSLYVNDGAQPFQSWKASDFRNGWVRSIIAKKDIPPKSDIAVCLKNSNSITRTELLKDSTIGLYEIPYFEPNVGVTKSASTRNAMTGQELVITVTARNSGSQPANVNIFMEDESDIVKVLRGQTHFVGTIEPGESIAFDYAVKPYYIRPSYIAPGEESQITLSSAVLEYDNEFGEIVSVKSNRFTLSVREPEFDVLPTLLPEKQSLKLGESTTVWLAIQNNGKEDLQNINVFVQVPKGLEVEEPGLGSISLKAGETKTFSFQAKAVQAGKQSIGCQAIYVDYEAKYSACGKTAVEVFASENNGAIVAGALLLVVGAFVYLVIYYR